LLLKSSFREKTKLSKLWLNYSMINLTAICDTGPLHIRSQVALMQLTPADDAMELQLPLTKATPLLVTIATNQSKPGMDF
jgi:hypothetical protein